MRDISDYSNDIALVFLRDSIDSPWVKNGTADTICLPQGSHDVPVAGKHMCIVIGWGITETGEESNVLKQARVPVLPTKACEFSWRYGRNGTYVDQRSMVCTGYQNRRGNRQKGVGTCAGDSGGPLQCMVNWNYWTVNGVISWESFNCLEKYSVVSNVTAMLPWIIAELHKQNLQPLKPSPTAVQTTKSANDSAVCKFNEFHTIRRLKLPGGIRARTQRRYSALQCVRECCRLGADHCASVAFHRRGGRCFTNVKSDCDFLSDQLQMFTTLEPIVYIGHMCQQ